MIKKIAIEIAGKDTELTLKEARQLLVDLRELFPDPYPVYQPYVSQGIPQYLYNSPYYNGLSSVSGSASSAFD